MAEKSKTTKKIDEKKVRAVEKLADKMQKSRTIMMVSIKNLPSAQFQKIKKDLRNRADINVFKNTIVERAIDKSKIPELQELKKHITADCALAFSNEDAFDLAAWLFKNRSPISAKQGQICEEDIKVEAGPTSLIPGPDISLLSSAGLQVSVEGGKIAIRKAHTLVKKGDPVKENVVGILQKLEIKPFMIGLNPAIIYDGQSKKVYVGVKINKDKALSDLITAKAKALGFAQKLNITNKDTIGPLLGKANAHYKALNKFQSNKP